MTLPAALDPDGRAAIDLPPARPARPWIYANVIMSANGIVTWTRAGIDDDPVQTVAGGDFSRPGRRADVRLMRRLRAAADAVSFGAQTLRDQPDLIGGVADAGGDLGAALVRERAAQGRPPIPLQVVYSESGRLDLSVPIFTTPGVTPIVVTTAAGARRLGGVTVLVAGEERIGPSGLVRAHERLFADFGVRHLDCEGGAVILEALHRAGILDEIFVTVTDVHIDPAAHTGVKRIASLDEGRAHLIAEGLSAADSGYRFQRWRFNEAGR